MNIINSNSNIDNRRCVKCVLKEQRKQRWWKAEREETLAYVVNELLTIKEEIFDLMYQVNPFFELPDQTGGNCAPLESIICNYRLILDQITRHILKKSVQFDFKHLIKKELARDSSIGIRYALRYHVEDKQLKKQLNAQNSFIGKFLLTCDLCRKQAAAETLQKKSNGKYLMELTYLADCSIYGIGERDEDQKPPPINFNSTDTFTINSCVTTLDIFNL